MRVLEDLNLNGLKIYQDDELYRFTSDAVVLSRFATVKAGDKVADFCSGSGIVGIHLYGLNEKAVKSVTLFEMQKSLYELSLESINFNGLQDKFFAVNTRLQDIGNDRAGEFSLIVCNPPYMEKGSGPKDEKECIAVCKREETLALKELVFAASKCLKFGGRFALCHRADRLADVIFELRTAGIEPKRLQLIYSGNKKPYLFCIEGVRGGKPGLDVLTPLEN